MHRHTTCAAQANSKQQTANRACMRQRPRTELPTMNASQDRQIDHSDTNDTATQLHRERLANARLRKLIDAHSRIAAAKLDLDRFLSLVTDSLLELVPAAHASVVEWVDGDEMVYRACSGTIAHHIGLRLKRVGSLSGLCSLEKHLLYSSDTSDDPRV